MWLKQMLILIVLATALITGVLVKRNQLGQADSKQFQANDLPDFQFPDVNGHSQSIKQWSNKVLVINFWATWCPPCLDELPDFNQLHAQYQNLGVQFVGVALDEAKDVRSVITRFKIAYPQLIAGDNGIKLSQSLGNHLGAVPFTIIVDARGLVVQRHAGLYERSGLVAEIDRLIH